MDKRPAGYLSALPVCLGMLLVAAGGWDVRLGCVTPGRTLPLAWPERFRGWCLCVWRRRRCAPGVGQAAPHLAW